MHVSYLANSLVTMGSESIRVHPAIPATKPVHQKVKQWEMRNDNSYTDGNHGISLDISLYTDGNHGISLDISL